MSSSRPKSSGGDADAEPGGTGDDTGVEVRLAALLLERDMTLTELSRRTGITMANLSILKNNRARAIRMSTIAALCRALDVTPGDLLRVTGQHAL